MSIAKKVAKNTIIQITGKMFSAVLVLIATGMLTRYLGTSGYGEYSTALAFLAFFGVLADMGLYTALAREISQEGSDQSRAASNIFTLRLVIDIIAFSLVPVIALGFNYSDIVKQTIAIGSLAFLFVSSSQVLYAIFQKELRVNRIAIAEIAGKSVFLIVSIFIIKYNLGRTSISFMGAMVLADFVIFALIILFARKYVKLRLRFDIKYWKHILKIALPISLAIIFNRIYFKLDTVILSIFKSSGDVGIYNLPYRFLEVLLYLAIIFVGIIFPILSRYANADRTKFKLAFKHGQDVLICAAIPLITGGIVLASPIITLLGGQEFSASALVFKLLIFSAGIMFLNSLTSNVIIAIGREKDIAKIHAFGATISIVIYLILIPLYSYIGAAASTFIVESAMLVLSYVVIYKHINYIPSFKSAAYSFVSSLIMAAALIGLIKIRPFNLASGKTAILAYAAQLLAYILAGIAVYIAAMYFTGGTDKLGIKNLIRS